MEPSRDFFSDSRPAAVRAVLGQFPLEEALWWLSNDTDGLGLDLQLEEATKKYFPASNSSRDVRDALVVGAVSKGCRVRVRSSVEQLARQEGPGLWELVLRTGERILAHRVVLATGGLSFPTLGTTGTGHEILRGLGVKIVPTYPALTPLTGRHPGAGAEGLAGVSLYDCSASVVQGGRRKASAERAGFLFSHKGFTGPAVLDLSHHLIRQMLEQQQPQGAPAPAPQLRVGWTSTPADEWDRRLGTKGTPGSTTVLRLLRNELPARLAEALLRHCGVPLDRRGGAASYPALSFLVISAPPFTASGRLPSSPARSGCSWWRVWRPSDLK